LGIRHGPLTQEIAAAVQGAGASLLVVGAAPHLQRLAISRVCARPNQILLLLESQLSPI